MMSMSVFLVGGTAIGRGRRRRGDEDDVADVGGSVAGRGGVHRLALLHDVTEFAGKLALALSVAVEHLGVAGALAQCTILNRSLLSSGCAAISCFIFSFCSALEDSSDHRSSVTCSSHSALTVSKRAVALSVSALRFFSAAILATLVRSSSAAASFARSSSTLASCAELVELGLLGHDSVNDVLHDNVALFLGRRGVRIGRRPGWPRVGAAASSTLPGGSGLG